MCVTQAVTSLLWLCVTDSALLHRAELLEATPEDRPLIADIQQSPPVSFSSNSRDSGSQPTGAAAAAVAAVAAVSHASLMDGPQPPAESPALQPPPLANGAALQSADAHATAGSQPLQALEQALAADVDSSTASPPAAATATAAGGDVPAGTAAAAGDPATAPAEAAAQPAAAAAPEARPLRPPPPPLQRGELLDAFK
jgi:hypothetical protein